MCGTVAACVAACPCSLSRCSQPRDASPSTPHPPGLPWPRPSRSRKTTSTPSTPGAHGRTRERRCPSRPCPSLRPHVRPASFRRRPCSRAGPARARGPRGGRRDSARPAGSRAQDRRPGSAAPDDPVPARRAPRCQAQAQEGEGAEPYTAPPGTRPRGGGRGHDGAVPRRARRHQPRCGRPLPPDLRMTECASWPRWPTGALSPGIGWR